MPKLRYSEGQKEFILHLLREERCSYSMISELTGVPPGSLNFLCGTLRDEHRIKGRLWRVRRMAVIRAKYSDHLAQFR